MESILESLHNFYHASKLSAETRAIEKPWDQENIYIATDAIFLSQDFIRYVSTPWLNFNPFQYSEMPFNRQRRYMGENYKLPYHLASELFKNKRVGDFFDGLVYTVAQRLSKTNYIDAAVPTANWIINDLLKYLKVAVSFNERDTEKILDEPIYSDSVINALWPVENISVEVEAWCKKAVENNPKAAAQFREGLEKALNSLKGPVMKEAKGKVSPAEIDKILRKLLNAK